MGRLVEDHPEDGARWAAGRKEVEDRIAAIDAFLAERAAERERRVRRLRRLTFGLLPR